MDKLIEALEAYRDERKAKVPGEPAIKVPVALITNPDDQGERNVIIPLNAIIAGLQEAAQE